jgi:hypothetical protein
LNIVKGEGRAREGIPDRGHEILDFSLADRRLWLGDWTMINIGGAEDDNPLPWESEDRAPVVGVKETDRARKR